jgi:hypothetical protein
MANDVSGAGEDEGDFAGGETAEVIEFDDAGEIGVGGGELVEGEVEIEEGGGVGGGGGRGVGLGVEGKRAAAAAFGGCARAGIVHEHLAHDAGHQGEEMDAIGELRGCPAENFQVGLVDERGGLESVCFGLPAEEGPGQAAELVIQVGGQVTGPLRAGVAEMIEDVAAVTLHEYEEYSGDGRRPVPRLGLADPGKYGMIDTRQRPEGRVGKQ